MDEEFLRALAAYRDYSRRPYPERRLSDFMVILDSMFPVTRYSAIDRLLEANLRHMQNLDLLLLYNRPSLETRESTVSNTPASTSTAALPATTSRGPSTQSKRTRSDRDDTQEEHMPPKGEPKFHKGRPQSARPRAPRPAPTVRPVTTYSTSMVNDDKRDVKRRRY